jgi:hypothetical protein
VAVLERDKPILGLFETLESGRDDGIDRRREKAPERRSAEREAEARGEKSSKGRRAERGTTDDFG